MLHPKIKSELKTEIVKIGSVEELKGKVLLIRVGSPQRPATQDDLYDISVAVSELLEGIDTKVLVTHHDVTAQITEDVELDSKV